MTTTSQIEHPLDLFQYLVLSIILLMIEKIIEYIIDIRYHGRKSSSFNPTILYLGSDCKGVKRNMLFLGLGLFSIREIHKFSAYLNILFIFVQG